MPKLAPDSPATMALVGRHFRICDHYDVGREKVREFARAVRNRHPAHHYEADAAKLGWEAITAPPTFLSVVGMVTTHALLDTVLIDYDLSQILQTDQVFEIHRPILAGDRLYSEAVIESIRRTRGNDFIAVKAIATDEHGSVVQVGITTIVARLGEADPNIVRQVEGLVMQRAEITHEPEVLLAITPEQATVVPDLAVSRAGRAVDTEPEFESLAAGVELPARTMRLTRGDLVNYAGVSGDPNPIHYSNRAAGLAGLPTVVAHGMLTMGLGAEYLTGWLGDPTAIESYSVRFASLVPIDPLTAAEIEFTGKVKSVDPQHRTATVLLNAAVAGKKLFGRAMAQVRLS
jgi:acyl dehydratase